MLTPHNNYNHGNDNANWNDGDRGLGLPRSLCRRCLCILPRISHSCDQQTYSGYSAELPLIFRLFDTRLTPPNECLCFSIQSTVIRQGVCSRCRHVQELLLGISTQSDYVHTVSRGVVRRLRSRRTACTTQLDTAFNCLRASNAPAGFANDCDRIPLRRASALKQLAQRPRTTFRPPSSARLCLRVPIPLNKASSSGISFRRHLMQKLCAGALSA